ncbi:hypothetical protein [Salinibacillus xinjiangensis]|uniref:Uncharacterized protein n=1 Tax=Salinibacillus xinjiangensis TaxID=1229268 RepID=A0A6G1X7P3_9BACI|nr:hypothetical protein [Salinibacillus xinjiangensis]MRG87023.1 hypothetical protein [Salinibacillus xinjiangensis]
MDLEQRYEQNLVKTHILNVAAQLENDAQYTKKKAVEELVEIVDMMEK